MPLQIKIRRDSSGDFQTANTVLADGEIALETDTGKMKVGNGSTAYNSLQFVTEDAAKRLFVFEATTSVFNAGGSAPYITEIHKMPVASQDSWSDIGDLITAPSSDLGYDQAGYNDESGNGYVLENGQSSTKVVFASDSISNLSPSFAGTSRTGFSANGNQLAGYVTGQYGTLTSGKLVYASATYTSTIPAMTITTNTSDPDASRKYTSGAPSGTFAFNIGGGSSTSHATTRVEKLNMSTETGGSIDVGDLTTTTSEATATAGETHAYSLGGRNHPDNSGNKRTMDKISFATDGNATSIGNLVLGRKLGSATSSTSYGFISGGRTSTSNTNPNTTERWPFASDSSSSNIPATMPSSGSKHGRSTMND